MMRPKPKYTTRGFNHSFFFNDVLLNNKIRRRRRNEKQIIAEIRYHMCKV